MVSDIQKYKNEYNKNNYATITLRIPKEKRAVLQKLSEKKDMSINQLIITALEKQYKVNLTTNASKHKDSK